MAFFPSDRTPDTSRRATRLIGLLLLMLGTLTLAGWLLQHQTLVRILPGSAAMAANTTLCFLLAGAALLLPGGWRRRGQAAVGTVLMLVALAELSQDLLKIDLGIDDLFRADWLGDPRPHATRMIVVTAVAFALAGLTLVLSHRRRRAAVIVVRLLSLVIGLIGLVTLTGHLLHLEFLFKWYPYIHMAANSAAGLMALSIGLWLNDRRPAPDRQPREQIEKRHVLLAGAAILVTMAVISGIASFLMLEGQTTAMHKRTLELTLSNRVDVYRTTIEQGVTSTLTIATRPAIRRELERLAAAPGSRDALAFLRSAIGSFNELGFNGVAIRDTSGRGLVSAGRFATSPDLRLPLNLPYRAELLWHEGMVLHIEVPMFDRRRHFATVITERPVTLMTKLLYDIRGIGKTGEMAVCGSDAGQITCFPTRLKATHTHTERRPGGQPLPMSHALDGRTGVSNMRDYRGHDVIAAYGPIGDTGLGMVVKMDSAELYEPIYRQLQRVLLMLAGLVIAGLVLLRWRLRPLLRRLVESGIVLRAANAELRDSEARIRTIIESTTDAVYIKDHDGRYLLINSAGAEILGRAPETVIGHTDAELFPEDSARGVRDHDREVMESGRTLTQEDVVDVIGGKRVFLSNRAPYRDDDGQVLGVVGISRDITERKQAEEMARALSLTDALTGLYNRRGFLELATPLLEREARSARHVFLFFADLDGLKHINDTFGHAEGDRAIADAAQTLRATFRESDIIARLSGDEFAVLAPDTHPEDAETILQRLDERIAVHNHSAGRPYPLAITVGAVHYDPQHASGIEALLAQGDVEMYRKKKLRRA